MNPISFDLHKLGWKAFEDLVACIFREVMGQTFQSFADGADGGRDGSFHGEWSQNGCEKMSGTFTIQCKLTSKPGKILSKAMTAEELPKIARLAKDGLCDNYLLVTNHTLSANAAQQAEEAFLAAGAGAAKVYGEKWISAIIAENPTLRRLVPRLYGLGDLTQIVTHQAYRQAREVLDSLSPDLACFVPTGAYRRCAHALKEHGFVLLIGEPASGKTMIANLLALSAADEWDLQTLMIASPGEFSQYWNPDDPGQFLWVDDAFGANQYDPTRVREWNHRLAKLKTAIHKGARVVFTSRDYIFNSAKNDLKISAFELFEDSRVVIEVEGLTETERQMILYNHLKCGKQPVTFRQAVKPFLFEVSATPKFLPEIARRFSNPKFTSGLLPASITVTNFFNKPQGWLESVLSNLSSADKAAIALVFNAGGRLQIPLDFDDSAIQKTISTMASSVGRVKASLNALNDSLLRRAKDNGREYWEFRHPTIRDAFASIIGSNPEFIDIYLAGVPTEQMIREVTCGEMGLEGVKIIIPPERYGAVLDRLRSMDKKLDLWSWFYDPVLSFLAGRCSCDFLQLYYAKDDDMASLPKSINAIEAYDDSLKILKRLQAVGLLPEQIRKDTSQRIRSWAESRYSVNFMKESIVGNLLTGEETKEEFSRLKDRILTNDFEIIDEISNDWDGDGDPEDKFYDLLNTLDLIEEDGGEEEEDLIYSFKREIKSAVAEMEKKRPPATEYESLEAEETTTELEKPARSIFDDVDE